MAIIIQGDALEKIKELGPESIDCVITSPPYWGFRDYGTTDQIGLEKTPEEYIAKMVQLFGEIKRVLKKSGTVWLNLGDSYANTKVGNTETKKNPRAVTNTFKKELPDNLKAKDLVGIPWRVALALQANGWYLRQDIIWSKPNPMPESVLDRCTKAHEYIFLLTKSARYFFDNEAIKEKTLTFDNSNRDRDNSKLNNTPGRTRMAGLTTNDYEMRNKRSVWHIGTQPFEGAHFATFPPALIEPMVRAGCPKGGTILDPFFGSGTTGMVAKRWERDWVGIELNPEYIKIAEQRLRFEPTPLFA